MYFILFCLPSGGRSVWKFLSRLNGQNKWIQLVRLYILNCEFGPYISNITVLTWIPIIVGSEQNERKKLCACRYENIFNSICEKADILQKHSPSNITYDYCNISWKSEFSASEFFHVSLVRLRMFPTSRI